MLEHLDAPVFVYNAQVLKVELFNNQSCELVVTILDEELNYVLCLELVKLCVGDSPCKELRIAHFRQHNRVFDDIDVQIR